MVPLYLARSYIQRGISVRWETDWLIKMLLDVLAHIQDRWDIMTKDDCVPVHVALQLMDFSSLGRGNDYEDFQQTSKQLQKALKAIVNGTDTTHVYRHLIAQSL